MTKCVSQEDNAVLLTPHSMQDLKELVMPMNPDSSPGPDGFSSCFFQSADKLSVKTFIMLLKFSMVVPWPVPKGFTWTLMTLIPKVANSERFDELRPIILCNFFYKILAKSVLLRLFPMLPKLISAVWLL